MQQTALTQGILKSFDGVNWLATVQVTGSLSAWLRGVPVLAPAASEFPSLRPDGRLSCAPTRNALSTGAVSSISSLDVLLPVL